MTKINRYTAELMAWMLPIVGVRFITLAFEYHWGWAVAAVAVAVAHSASLDWYYSARLRSELEA